MRMAKSIANEIISYKVIPQSLPKIKFWQTQLSSGDAAIESGTSKNHYSIYLLFCIGICKNVSVSVFFLSAAGTAEFRFLLSIRMFSIIEYSP